MDPPTGEGRRLQTVIPAKTNIMCDLQNTEVNKKVEIYSGLLMRNGTWPSLRWYGPFDKSTVLQRS